VLYAYDVSVIAIRACTTTSDPPIALDVFTVGFGNRPVPGATLKHVSAAISDVLKGSRTIEELLRQKGKDPGRKQQVFSYSYVEGHPSILEIQAPRGRGMPFRFSRLLSDQGWNVLSARVGQWAGNAAAAFYLVGPDGEPLAREIVDKVLSDVASPQP
jgi:[protein-PII] uridylyltransferase